MFDELEIESFKRNKFTKHLQIEQIPSMHLLRRTGSSRRYCTGVKLVRRLTGHKRRYGTFVWLCYFYSFLLQRSSYLLPCSHVISAEAISTSEYVHVLLPNE